MMSDGLDYAYLLMRIFTTPVVTNNSWIFSKSKISFKHYFQMYLKMITMMILKVQSEFHNKQYINLYSLHSSKFWILNRLIFSSASIYRSSSKGLKPGTDIFLKSHFIKGSFVEILRGGKTLFGMWFGIGVKEVLVKEAHERKEMEN